VLSLANKIVFRHFPKQRKRKAEELKAQLQRKMVPAAKGTQICKVSGLITLRATKGGWYPRP